MLPFSLLPIILLMHIHKVWGFIAMLKLLEHMHLDRYQETHVDYEPG
jgi:hypothetical protein